MCRNQKLLSHLPNGFTATATAQVAGRGRGSNVWVSPVGSLIFSTCIRHSLELSAKAPVIFVQYLAAIAIAEGIKTYGKGYEDIPVKLKWPNDICKYNKCQLLRTLLIILDALDPTKPGNKEYVKIGGILVNSSYSSGNYNLVVGIGINTTNAAPTTSLNALRPQHLPEFTIEKLLARILTKFEDIYIQFCRSGFDKKLEETYYKLWLHSEQIITLEAEGGVRARVLGITRDWGFLRVQELGWEDKPTGTIIELQTDSNSFDFFRGLVKRKV
jgi:biotin--protein ligase